MVASLGGGYEPGTPGGEWSAEEVDVIRRKVSHLYTSSRPHESLVVAPFFQENFKWEYDFVISLCFCLTFSTNHFDKSFHTSMLEGWVKVLFHFKKI